MLSEDFRKEKEQYTDAVIPLSTSIQQVTLWNRHKRVQAIVSTPIQPLVALIGPMYVTAAVKKIINDQTKLMRQ